jgi:hypothetical protein
MLHCASDTWDVYEEASNATLKHTSSNGDFMLNLITPGADFSHASEHFCVRTN